MNQKRNENIMERLKILERADAGFGRTLTAVTGDDWKAATVCGDWTVSELVRHMIGGSRMAVALLEGADAASARAVSEGSTLGHDPVDTFASASAGQLAAFRAADSLDRIVRHPMNDIPAHQLVEFRIYDAVLHTWDLARAVGADDRLDDALVETVWEGLSPLASVIGQLGVFGEGPSGAVGEEAPLQSRLLDLTGRRP